jgi:hypothetical protein
MWVMQGDCKRGASGGWCLVVEMVTKCMVQLAIVTDNDCRVDGDSTSPLHISKSNTPNAYTSALWLTCAPPSSSGAW